MAKHSSVFSYQFMAFLLFTGPIFAVVDKWTPAGFNWSFFDPGPVDTWNGLYYNLSDSSVAVDTPVMALGQMRTTAEDGSMIFVIPFAVRAAWQVINVALTGVGLTGAIQGCIQNEGKPLKITFCVGGLLSTIIGVGNMVSAAKKFATARGYLGAAARSWQRTGLDDIDLTVFQRRGLESAEMEAQMAHNYFVHQALSTLSDGPIQFVGYAPDNHKLTRAASTEHPFAAMFRFKHQQYGSMEVTSRDTGATGIQFTISYEGHPTHLATREKRDEYYQHELETVGLVEGRFDSAASLADPANISFDGAAAFPQIEAVVECALGDSWPDGHVLSAQMYDLANKATFWLCLDRPVRGSRYRLCPPEL